MTTRTRRASRRHPAPPGIPSWCRPRFAPFERSGSATDRGTDGIAAWLQAILPHHRMRAPEPPHRRYCPRRGQCRAPRQPGFPGVPSRSRPEPVRPAPRSSKARTRLLPMNPAPPVTKYRAMNPPYRYRPAPSAGRTATGLMLYPRGSGSATGRPFARAQVGRLADLDRAQAFLAGDRGGMLAQARPPQTPESRAQGRSRRRARPDHRGSLVCPSPCLQRWTSLQKLS